MKSSRILIPLLAAAVLSACSRHEQPARVELPTISVKGSVVSSALVPVLSELTGTVHSVRRASVAAKVMGAIKEMPLVLGQQVKAGELLVQIEAAEITARVAQAKVALSQAQRELEREAALLPKGASTADLVRSMEERVQGAEALLSEAQAMRDYTQIKAPFNAYVSRKYAMQGDLATPGQPLLELEGGDDYEVELGVPESLASSLTRGASMQVRNTQEGLSFVGTVKEISSAAEPLARTVTVKLQVPAGTAVRSGQFVRVLVPGTAVSAIQVPASAVSLLGQMERVFVIQEGRAIMRVIKTGALRGDFIEVVSGLSAGDKIVTKPALQLRDGQRVEVQP